METVGKEAINSPWLDYLSINLKMKASDAFRAIPLTEEQEEAEEADEIRAKNKFQWHTQKGIIKKKDVYKLK